MGRAVSFTWSTQGPGYVASGSTRSVLILRSGKCNNWQRNYVSADNLGGGINFQVHLFCLYECLSVPLLKMGVDLNLASAKPMGILPPPLVGLRFHFCRL